MTRSTTSRSIAAVFTRPALVRLAVAWAAVLALFLLHDVLAAPSPLVLTAALAGIIAVILYTAFGVVHEAERLAHRLGDPYGSLILTLTIVLIEVILIAAVMLGPGEHATIARDSVVAVMMIILNLVIGACLVVGGLRRGDLRVNRVGTSTYVAMILVLAALAFVVPSFAGVDGAYLPQQQIPIIIVVVLVYAWFLFRQTGAQAGDYREVSAAPSGSEHSGTASSGTASSGVRAVVREHGAELALRVVLLVATMTPIVLMSHDMAGLLDDALGRIGAPIALAGILIAFIVFTPETITALRAAAAGEMQRVVNLCLGAFVSTVGLTIPAVLIIGMLTGQQIILAPSFAELALVIMTLILTAVTFTSPRVTASHGALHLALFAVYPILVFTT